MNIGVRCALLLFTFVSAALAADTNPATGTKGINANGFWEGLANRGLESLAPENGAITNQAAWDALWKAWGTGRMSATDQPASPAVDFDKDLIVVVFGKARSQRVHSVKSMTLNERGDLQVVVEIGDEIGGTGFGYGFVEVPKEGIKSLGGKPLVAAAGGKGIALATATAPSVRERLVEVARISEELQGKAGALPAETERMLAIVSDVPEDSLRSGQKRYAHRSEVAAYTHGRPWSIAYQGLFAREGSLVVETWPTPENARELRTLLADKDPVVRSLVVEALGALDLPEDVPRIAQLSKDQSAGAPVLGWSHPMSSMGEIISNDADPLLSDRIWQSRTVQIYAREALRVMTGHRFDGKDPAGVAFEDWWKTHDLGKESLWYWQQRLLRENAVLVTADKKAGESLDGFQQRVNDETTAYRTKLHSAALQEIANLSADAEAKIFLMTRKSSDDDTYVIGPINPLFPEGMKLRIGLPQLMEIVDGKRIWPDCADVRDARVVMLARVARMTPELLAGTENQEAIRASIRTALEKEAAGARWMPILVSRLMPSAANASEMDNPKTREGYLRRALDAATERYTQVETEKYARLELAKEMVRSNLEGQWPVLEKIFYSESSLRGSQGSDVRQGVLEALGEEPHTPAKLHVLVGLIDDPRNEAIFTQQERLMGMDMYRRCAVGSLNAIAGKEVVTIEVLQNLGTQGRTEGAIRELRRVAGEVKFTK